MKLAVYPGSFDPLTKGHLDLIERASALFDQVVVLVAHNQQKHYLFSPEKRLELVSASCAHLPNVRAEVVSGLVSVRASQLGASAIVKGIRSYLDWQAEVTQARVNRELSQIETLLLPAQPELAHLSSSLVKELALLGADISALVPQPVRLELNALFNTEG